MKFHFSNGVEIFPFDGSILLRFSNHATRPLPSVANYNTLMNAVGGDPVLAKTGSVRDYYLEASYGILTLDSTTTVWIDLPNTEAYYANGNSGLTTKPTYRLIAATVPRRR